MASNNSQKLPQKESGIFKKIVRCYECKQYKNGLKFAKQILSNPKYSEHGETLAMKGLILNSVGKRDEAFENVRKGLKNDLTSHVCWHVYGLLQRADRKYDEAIKCYRNALKRDKENVQILRDLSLLQIQMRDLEGFCDTRYQLLKVRPAQRSSWVGYALAYHMMKDYDMALKVMAEYRKTQTHPQKLPDYEFSEMILYEVQILMEKGSYTVALEHLEQYEQFISDSLSYLETKGEIYIKDNKLSKAEEIYHHLLKRNPENRTYYKCLEQCLELSNEEDKLKLYQVLREEFPRSHVCRRLPLDFVTGPTFHEMIDSYLRPPLHKGVPSLWVGLKQLYNDKEKVAFIGKLLTTYENNLLQYNKFYPDEPDPQEPPSALMWVWFFLAQHFDKLDDHSRALEYIEKAIEHTPTHIELYMLKSKIYKHAGDIESAAIWIDEARSLDTADRFVNCKCVKYLLRINQIDRAIEMASLFTREGLPALQTLDDMQCIWFQRELACAYRRTKQYGEALVKFHEIDKHFEDIIEDQFDFHTYCMRKMTLRPYIGVLRLEDHLRSHKSYYESAQDVIELYIYLHDNPDAKIAQAPPTELEVQQDLSHLSESERRKAKRKQRKALAKAREKAEHEKEKENKPHGKHDEDRNKQVVDDIKTKLDPKELLNEPDPLSVTLKFLIPLQMMCSNNIQTHLLAYAVHSRRRKYLLMLQSLKRANSIDSNNPQLHVYLIHFLVLLNEEKPDFPVPVRTVIDDTLPHLTNNKTLDELNQEFIAKNSNSLNHLVAAAQVLYQLHPDQCDKAIGLITTLSDDLVDKSLKMCVKVYNLLKSGTFGNCSQVLVEYSGHCHTMFPCATTFKPLNEALKDAPLGHAQIDKATSCTGVTGRTSTTTVGSTGGSTTTVESTTTVGSTDQSTNGTYTEL